MLSKRGVFHSENQTGSECEWFISISWPQTKLGAHGGGTKSSGEMVRPVISPHLAVAC